MTGALDRALALVLADFATTGAPPPRIDWVTWQTWDPSESAHLYAADGSGTGVWLDLGLPEQEALAHLADQVQDWAVEELCRLRLPTNWPVCPAHPDTHPQVAVAEHGRAVWTCPLGAARPTPVGGLPHP